MFRVSPPKGGDTILCPSCVCIVDIPQAFDERQDACSNIFLARLELEPLTGDELLPKVPQVLGERPQFQALAAQLGGKQVQHFGPGKARRAGL